MENQKLFYTINEVAEAISLGRTSIYKAINEGRLTAKKFGSKSLVSAESLDDFIAGLPNKEKVGGSNE